MGFRFFLTNSSATVMVNGSCCLATFTSLSWAEEPNARIRIIAGTETKPRAFLFILISSLSNVVVVSASDQVFRKEPVLCAGPAACPNDAQPARRCLVTASLELPVFPRVERRPFAAARLNHRETETPGLMRGCIDPEKKRTRVPPIISLFDVIVNANGPVSTLLPKIDLAFYTEFRGASPRLFFKSSYHLEGFHPSEPERTVLGVIAAASALVSWRDHFTRSALFEPSPVLLNSA